VLTKECLLKNLGNKYKALGDKVAALSQEARAKFLADFADVDDALLDVLDSDKGLEAWKALNIHPTLRINGDYIKKAQNVLQKGHISQADFETILTVNQGLGKRAAAVGDLLDDLDHFALYQNQQGFGSIISGLKADWYNGAGADGANWVVGVLRKNGTGVFPPSKTNFEVSMNIDGKTRRYDSIVDDAVTVGGNTQKRYFEFKSYSSVPPTNFAEQFINDLKNSDIKDLKQLRWMFDAAKNPPNFETNMKAAIQNLDKTKITPATLSKFGVSSADELISKIEDDFNEIFKLQ
jgi:hypothetical protein